MLGKVCPSDSSTVTADAARSTSRHVAGRGSGSGTLPRGGRGVFILIADSEGICGAGDRGRHKGAAAWALLKEQYAGSQLLSLLLLLSLPLLLLLLLLSLYLHSLFLLFVTSSLEQQQFHRGSFRKFSPFRWAFVTFSFSSWGSPSLRASLERGSFFLVFAWRPPPRRIPLLGFFPPPPSTTYPGCRPFRPSLRLAS